MEMTGDVVNENGSTILDIVDRVDLHAFTGEHARLFDDAKKTGDYASVTKAYYSVMAPIIASWNGGSFHFVGPYAKGQCRDDAIKQLHQQFSRNFLSGTVKSIVDCGKLNVLNGSTAIIFQKA